MSDHVSGDTLMKKRGNDGTISLLFSSYHVEIFNVLRLLRTNERIEGGAFIEEKILLIFVVVLVVVFDSLIKLTCTRFSVLFQMFSRLPVSCGKLSMMIRKLYIV